VLDGFLKHHDVVLEYTIEDFEHEDERASVSNPFPGLGQEWPAIDAFCHALLYGCPLGGVV
jgi:hypothetical protein